MDKEISENKKMPNQHITDYLEYYISLQYSPFFAVMLNGAWGTGKTFVLKHFLEEKFKNQKDYIYVSLYGIDSLEGVDKALLSAAFPILNNKGIKIAGKLASATQKYFKIDGVFKLKDLTKRPKPQVYIFDDLERTTLEPHVILGYINEFVEHEGAKVILIANESEVNKTEDYRKKREKVIGKTFEVQSEFKEAIKAFLGRVSSDEIKQFLNKYLLEIETLFYQSNISNLRILQQTLLDFERFYKVIMPIYKNHADGMLVLMRLFFAFSFELKVGRLQKSDLYDLMNNYAKFFSAKNKEEKNNFILSMERYPTIQMFDPILTDKLLDDILLKGLINSDEINDCLGKNEIFVTPINLPEWRLLWRYTDLSSQEFEEALKALTKKIDNRFYKNIGEIYHVFGLWLRFVRDGLIEGSVEEFIAEAKKYIDDLYTDNELEPLPFGEKNDYRLDGYGGLGIYENDSDEYKEVTTYLHERRTQAMFDKYPLAGNELLSIMKDNTDKFHSMVSFSRGSDSKDRNYWHVPILNHIEPDVFVTAVISLKPKQASLALSTIDYRFRGASLEMLKTESEWILKVKEEFEKQLSTVSKFDKIRFDKLIGWHIAPHLKDVS